MERGAGLPAGHRARRSTDRRRGHVCEPLKEPFAWAIASDNRSIVGADMDGYFLITLVSPDRMEKCYTHNAVGGGKSVVATCHAMDRKR